MGALYLTQSSFLALVVAVVFAPAAAHGQHVTITVTDTTDIVLTVTGEAGYAVPRRDPPPSRGAWTPRYERTWAWFRWAIALGLSTAAVLAAAVLAAVVAIALALGRWIYSVGGQLVALRGRLDLVEAMLDADRERRPAHAGPGVEVRRAPRPLNRAAFRRASRSRR